MGYSKQNLLRDPDFRMVQISANGSFSYKISDTVKFLSEMVGNVGVFETKGNSLRTSTSTRRKFASTLGQSKIPYLTYCTVLTSLGNVLLEKMKGVFLNDYGIE